MKKTAPVMWLVIVVASSLGMALVYFSTFQGPGIGGDATIYLTTARHFAEGKGLTLIGPQGEVRLLPYFPPFYPLVLSLFALVGLDLPAAANGLNILLFGGITALGGWVMGRITGRWIYAAGAALLGALSPVLVPVYSWAMSEPLAFALGFGGLGLVLAFTGQLQRRGLLIGAGIVLGLSFLTRYSAVAFLAVGVLAIWLFTRRSLRQKLFDTFLLGGVGVLPMVLWLAYDLSQTASVASRSLENSMAERAANFFPLLREVVLFWLIPDTWNQNPPYPAALNALLVPIAVGLIMILMAWALAGALRSRGDLRTSALVRWTLMLTMFVVVYLAVIAAVYITTYPPITIGDRMLAPLHLAVLWAVVGAAAIIGRLHPGRRWLHLVLPLLVFLVCGWYGARTARIVRQNYGQGLGYTSRFWTQSETLAALNQLSAGQLIVTNEEMAVLFLTQRPAYPLAEIYYNQPLEQFSAYGQGEIPAADRGQLAFRDNGALLVLFDSIGSQLSGLYPARTTERIETMTRGLQLVFRGEDGAIYRAP